MKYTLHPSHFPIPGCPLLYILLLLYYTTRMQKKVSCWERSSDDPVSGRSLHEVVLPAQQSACWMISIRTERCCSWTIYRDFTHTGTIKKNKHCHANMSMCHKFDQDLSDKRRTDVSISVFVFQLWKRIHPSATQGRRLCVSALRAPGLNCGRMAMHDTFRRLPSFKTNVIIMRGWAFSHYWKVKSLICEVVTQLN